VNRKLSLTAGSLALLLAFTALPALADNPFADVPANSWAYDAINQLAADGIIEGYPDKTFKGNRPLTRYEAAVLTQRAVKKLESELADVKTAQDVQQRDIDAVKKLLDEYGTEIKGLQTDVAQLKADDAATKKILARQQIHVYYFLRAPGTFSEKLTAKDTATGLTLPNGVLLRYSPNPGNFGQNQQFTGTNDHGTGYQVLRLVFRGNTDEHLSYGIRLEDRYCMDNATLTGSTCASQVGLNSISAVTPSQGSYPSNGLLRLNYAYVNYKDASVGYDVTGGRFLQSEGPDDLGLNYSDYFNGGLLHYKKAGLDFAFGYGFNQAANSNTGGAAGSSQQSLLGSVSYTFDKKFMIGGSYVQDNAWQNQLTWNASAFASPLALALLAPGNYVPTNTPISTISYFAQATLNPAIKIEFEGLVRGGKDPTTGANWQQPDAYWAQVNLGDSVGHRGKNLVELGYWNAGFNSTGNHTNLEGTTGYQQFFVAQPNGFKSYYASINHWLGDNARIGLVWQNYGVKNGTDIPAVYGTGAATLPAFVTGDNRNALTLETLLAF
jgi:hypothetical protein